MTVLNHSEFALLICKLSEGRNGDNALWRAKTMRTLHDRRDDNKCPLGRGITHGVNHVFGSSRHQVIFTSGVDWDHVTPERKYHRYVANVVSVVIHNSY